MPEDHWDHCLHLRFCTAFYHHQPSCKNNFRFCEAHKIHVENNNVIISSIRIEPCCHKTLYHDVFQNIASSSITHNQSHHKCAKAKILIFNIFFQLTVSMTVSFCFLLYVLSDHALRWEKGHTHFGKSLKR